MVRPKQSFIPFDRCPIAYIGGGAGHRGDPVTPKDAIPSGNGTMVVGAAYGFRLTGCRQAMTWTLNGAPVAELRWGQEGA